MIAFGDWAGVYFTADAFHCSGFKKNDARRPHIKWPQLHGILWGGRAFASLLNLAAQIVCSHVANQQTDSSNYPRLSSFLSPSFSPHLFKIRNPEHEGLQKIISHLCSDAALRREEEERRGEEEGEELGSVPGPGSVFIFVTSLEDDGHSDDHHQQDEW